MEAAVSANGSEVDNITQQLDATQLDADEQWEGALDVVFRGVRKIHGAEDGTSIGFHNLFEQKPASGRSKQRPDGLYEHQYARNLSEPYFSCNMQLAPAEKAEGKPPCFYWRSVPISDCAISRFQPNLPPMTEGSLPPIPNAEYATAIWAMEGYLQDGENRWSMGPIYSLQNLHLLTHMFIQEYSTTVNPDSTVSFAEQPMKEARGTLAADPNEWMDGGTWEGTMTDLLWDEDGELFRCSPRPAQWAPPALATGRKSKDSLLALKRLFLYPDLMYGYYPERLPATANAAKQRRGVRLEIGGMMRTTNEFRRVILRYNATGEVASLTEEVYHPSS